MKIYNTLSNKKEEFKPIKKNQVNMYVCGPTIYDYGHLGHGRSAINFDIIRRYFLYRNYKVDFIFNYTDIEDKIINKANKKKITVQELTKKFEKIYDEDYKKLNILSPTKKPKPTKHIKEIIELIKKIEKKGYTYKLDDGIYYDILKFKNYGKLSNQKIEKLKTGARIKINEKKKNPGDFILWKLAKLNEPSWQSPWGKGRPGWHIECSAMSLKYLKQPFDIHGGGQDLIFPHHENEIAQSEVALTKPFVNYWLHNGLVKINKEKMSKSLSNFITLREMFKKYDPLIFRYAIISTHYRNPIEISDKNLKQAEKSLQRIKNFVKESKQAEKYLDEKLIQNTKKEFIKAMDDDFDTPKALAIIFDFIRKANKLGNGKNAYKLLQELDKVFGILKEDKLKITKEIKELIKKREKARKEKDYKTADNIRKELKQRGILVEDTKSGFRLK
jgi:cysteinyl-tRNA synthetase